VFFYLKDFRFLLADTEVSMFRSGGYRVTIWSVRFYSSQIIPSVIVGVEEWNNWYWVSDGELECARARYAVSDASHTFLCFCFPYSGNSSIVGKEIVMILALAYTGLIEDYRLKILSGDDMAGCRDLA